MLPLLRAIRDDELEHVKTMFACERGTGDLVSPNEAAATPRWAEDAGGSKSKKVRAGGCGVDGEGVEGGRAGQGSIG